MSYIHGYTDEEAQRLRAQAEFLWPWVLETLPLDGVSSLLEVGVGVGAETRLMRRKWPSTRITGVDVSQGSLEHAKRWLADDAGVKLLRASGAKLPFGDAQFDAVVFVWVLEHVPAPQALMNEAARVVKPGGRVFAVEVYNQTLLVEPPRPIIDEYFRAVSSTQTGWGGHPNIAPRLPELAARADLEVAKFEMLPALGDGRDPAARTRLIRYFEGLMRSAEPQVRAAGSFPAERIPEVWRAFDEVVEAPDALLCYVGGRLEARRTTGR